MNKYLKKLKRGISLIEVVIAIFIITLITGTAITVISASAKNEQKNLRDTQVVLSTQTAIDCFNYANDFNEFLVVLSTVDSDYKNAQGTNVVTLEKQGYNLSIVADFNQKVITISAKDKAGKSLSNVTYKKG